MSVSVVGESLVKTFHRPGRGGTQVRALQDVSITLQAGEFLAIRGKSGCGKSTLMLALGGLQRPDSGKVLISDTDIYALPADRRAAVRASEVGFVFQQFHLIPYLTVADNILAARLGIPHRSTDSDRAAEARTQELMSRLGIADRADHRPSELSTGECQRVALARALLNRPKVILADEPTGNLDLENTDIVLGFLRQFADEGAAVLLVTHDSQCQQFVDREIQMADGKLQVAETATTA